ncbi:MAG: hypothetical protein ACRCX2_27350 [Paraclostridium sp.]
MMKLKNNQLNFLCEKMILDRYNQYLHNEKLEHSEEVFKYFITEVLLVVE